MEFSGLLTFFPREKQIPGVFPEVEGKDKLMFRI